MPDRFHDKICAICYKTFTPTGHNQKFCRRCMNWHDPEHRRQYRKNYHEAHRPRAKWIARRYNQKKKEIVIQHYSPDKVCVRCGFSDMRALSIDHINGGGVKHLIQLFGAKRGGRIFYEWLIENNFPEGFRVLCLNCQFIVMAEKTEAQLQEGSIKRKEVRGRFVLRAGSSSKSCQEQTSDNPTSSRQYEYPSQQEQEP